LVVTRRSSMPVTRGRLFAERGKSLSSPSIKNLIAHPHHLECDSHIDQYLLYMNFFAVLHVRLFSFPECKLIAQFKELI
jgi:hypothetical protein